MTDSPKDNSKNRPDGAALLWQARETLMTELLPTLPEAARLNALMIANAMSIAAREIEDHEARRTPEAGPDGPPEILAADIRAGRWDAATSVHETLRRETTAQLEIANPKALEA